MFKKVDKGIRTRRLGLCLIAVAVYEISVAAAVAYPVLYPVFFPMLLRIGTLWILPDWEWQVLDFVNIPMAEIVSAGWLVALGLGFIFGKRPLKTYVVLESLFALPSFLLAVTLIATGGGHMLVGRHGVVTLVVLLVFTVGPIRLAIQAMKEGRSPVSAP